MTSLRRWLFLGLVLLGTQLSAGCYLGLTNRPVLFPGVALSPAYAHPAAGNPCAPCGPTCYREFGGSGCGGSLFAGSSAGYGPAGAPVVSGPVYDAGPIGYGGAYPVPAGAPGCAGCGAGAGVPLGAVPVTGIPIAVGPGGPPIAVTPPAGGPIHGIPFDSGTVPTLKPPPGSVPLQMPSEVKESKKVIAAGK